MNFARDFPAISCTDSILHLQMSAVPRAARLASSVTPPAELGRGEERFFEGGKRREEKITSEASEERKKRRKEEEKKKKKRFTRIHSRMIPFINFISNLIAWKLRAKRASQ